MEIKELEKNKQEVNNLIIKSNEQLEYMKGYLAGFKERDDIENLSEEDKLSWARRTLFELAYPKN